MKVDLYNQNAEVLSQIELPNSIFGVPMNHDLLFQAVNTQSANARNVIAHTKGRGDVRGGGKKPWKQKGTGRARHASIRSPIWKGGGVAFGPTKERNFEKKINKKMKRKALFMALSSKVKDHQIMMLDSFKLNEAKTKQALGIIKTLSGKFIGYKETKRKKDSILFIVPAQDTSLLRAVRNLSSIGVLSAKTLNVKEVLTNKYLIVLKDSIPVIEQTYKI